MTLSSRNLPPVQVKRAHLHKSEASKLIHDVWDGACGNSFAPTLGKTFKLDDLDFVIIPCISIVDVIDGGKDYYYRFWGTRNVEVKGLEMTGKLLSDGPLPQVINYGFQQFSKVIKRREPTAFIYHGPYHSPIQRQQTTYRFPLSSDGEIVDGILSYQDLNNQVDEWSEKFDEYWEGEKPILSLGRAPKANY